MIVFFEVILSHLFKGSDIFLIDKRVHRGGVIKCIPLYLSILYRLGYVSPLAQETI